jgi:hypothetical protein
VGPSAHSLLYVLLSPVGPYYPEGFKPVKLLADEKYVRAWPGGTGDYKVGGCAPACLRSCLHTQRVHVERRCTEDMSNHKCARVRADMHVLRGGAGTTPRLYCRRSKARRRATRRSCGSSVRTTTSLRSSLFLLLSLSECLYGCT